MIQSVFRDEEQNFEWLDVTSPSAEDYQTLTEKYDLHPAAVKDCLSPNHLPKYERIGETAFLITRIYDENSQTEADTIQQLTNKVALFVSEEYLITIHRKKESFIEKVKKKWQNPEKLDSETPSYLLNQLLNKILHTYDGAMERAAEGLDTQETRIFNDTKNSSQLIREMYIVKRRASVFKRMIFLTKETMEKYARFSDVQDPFTQDLLDTVESLHFVADELHENVNNLLNLHISLTAHRTNEIMSLLTIFSIAFLVPTLIAGLYGMNFNNMPELQSSNGYFIALTSIIVMVLGSLIGLSIWFKRKGLL
ncbi:CorA family divalent cation transporter [Flexithrix dorotheae]|uniref:CorA family divalent cation transporter n=1 Tax=Flexithrix dorotheae TaxID=70993 RepID=UPI000371535F|nr:CorA family divalent cation transporter [Flexithrix dorotheae]